MTRNYAYLFFLTLTIIFNCSNGTTTDNPFNPGGNGKDKINLGQPVQVSSTNVTAAGAQIEVQMPGAPIDGMEIDIPNGAFKQFVSLSLSYTPITSHNLGEFFNPVSPLITINDGGVTSDSIISVKIPIQITSDEFAMAFYYDKTKGTLEGMPTIELTTDYITVGTRHFSNIVVSKIQNYKLTGNATTEFEPGYDDWQFPNHGSYIAAGGHCAGQSIMALWYYCEKERNGEHYLYGLYDNDDRDDTPKLWEDDVLPYKLCSVIQRVINWENASRAYWRKFNKLGDNFTLKAFEYSIKLTEEPQYVEIWNSADSSGHAMVIYGVSGNSLLVADPNFPGNTSRRITYSGSKFIPYNSGADVDAIEAGYTINFDGIVYVAKSAIIPFETLQAGWNDFENKVIGGPSWFPNYQIVFDAKGLNRTITMDDSFGVAVPKFTLSKSFGPQESLGWNLYKFQELIEPDDKVEWELEPGLNEIGVNVMAKVKDSWEWYDFFYFQVFYDDVPFIDWIDPDTGPTGITMEISGYNFKKTQGSSTVWFDNYEAAQYVEWSDTLIKVKVPSGIEGTVDVTVTVAGKTSEPAEYTVSAIELKTVSPDTAIIGQDVTLTGAGFGASQGSGKVIFTDVSGLNSGIIATQITTWADDRIVVKVPKSSGTGKIYVRNGSLKESNKLDLFIRPNIEKISAQGGEARGWFGGQLAIITGGGFGKTQGASTVTFNGVPATNFTQWGDGDVRCEVPQNATSGNVIITVGTLKSAPYQFIVGVSDWLHSMTTIMTTAGGTFTLRNTSSGITTTNSSIEIGMSGCTSPSIHWSGNNFTSSCTFTSGAGTKTVQFNGSVDASGVNIVQLTCNENYDENSGGRITTRRKSYTLNNIPISSGIVNSCGYVFRGDQMASHVTDIAYSDKYEYPSSPSLNYEWVYESINYSSSSATSITIRK